MTVWLYNYIPTSRQIQCSTFQCDLKFKQLPTLVHSIYYYYYPMSRTLIIVTNHVLTHAVRLNHEMEINSDNL